MKSRIPMAKMNGRPGLRGAETDRARRLPGSSNVIAFPRAALLARDPRRPLAYHPPRCTKCQSTFVTPEPAFLHCHYCGNMARVTTGSLLEQEMFERRAGLRIAS